MPLKHWAAFLDTLDSPGGHILLLVAMMFAGLCFNHMELTVGSTAALFTVLRSTQSNVARSNTQGDGKS